MKILSYNVNGIRAALKKDFAQWLEATDPDVLCLQETKALKEQVETSIFEQLGYHHFWFSAQKKGYSGVAIFSKIEPEKVIYGSGIGHMDFEGRILRADFDQVSVISLYLPSGTNVQRLEYKFKFMHEFHNYILSLSIFFLVVTKSNTNLVTIIAVNILTIIPQKRTVAKPLIGPLPY